jgi:Replication-relaxation
LKLQSIAVSLTERDQRICADLFEHRILTTIQLFELHFPTYPRARKRLLQLYRLGLVWRTRPLKHPGSLPWHYVLDEPGALVVADSRGIERNELSFRFDKVLGVMDSQRLRHLRETNGFFTRLAYACRRSDERYRLAEWWSERTCVERWQGLIRPDGLARLEGPDGSVTFALELDRGTEPRDRLSEKLERYGLITDGPDGPDAVLFCFTSGERERSAREVLARPTCVATTSLERYRGDPLGHVWRQVGADRRERLIDLTR